MRVNLLSYTPDALDILVFTKNTRLAMSPGGLDEVKRWPQSKKLQELKYMLGTIQSSWEFVEYIFSIENVTRAFTHQLVRHRVGTSFAQQSHRTVEMDAFTYAKDEELVGVLGSLYEGAMGNIQKMYNEMTKLGAKPEAARGILPTNIHTNIIFKANLRTLHDMALKRLCLVKAQQEFQDVMYLLRARVLEVHPWAEPFLRVHCAATGTCCFENVKPEDCPIKPHVYDPDTGGAFSPARPIPATRSVIQQAWMEYVNKPLEDRDEEKDNA